jgi:hypothetical protein
MKKYLLFILLGLLFVFSCKKDNELHLDMGYNYVPNDVGRYVIYDVDSIVYNGFTNDTVSFKYQLMEYAQAGFNDNEGRPSLRIERSIRNFNPLISYDSIPWTLKNVWYSTRTNRHYERVEDNIRYVKMIFPALAQATWDGNAQNTMGDWEYQYGSVNQKMTVGTSAFDSTLQVLEKVDTNLLYYKMYTNTYAKNVGLISRQVIDVADVNIVFGVSVLHRIKSGVIYRATVHSYGKM